MSYAAWPTLEAAIEKKLDDQEVFVNWWRDSVRGPGKSNSSRPGLIAADAEAITGITQPQVSKWAKRLAKRDAYRVALYGAAIKATEVIPEGAGRVLRGAL